MKIEKVTPVKTWDWYIKWIASIILLSAMVVRGIGNYQLADMCLSLAGCLGWVFVGFHWDDRAILVLNSIASFILFTGIINNLVGKI
jgi:hypothetical protein